jgi:hypothetical protein
MKRLALICLLFVSPLFTILLYAQSTFPTKDGERIKYNAYIETPRAYISGISILLREGDQIKGSLFNEFGITALDFTYDPRRQKVKLHSVIMMMDKWYIRRVVRKDLAQLMICLQEGKTEYRNERRRINYQFRPIDNEVTK